MKPFTTNVTRAQALRMLAEASMRPFTKDDWYGFAGCETENPLIGEINDHIIVLDGDMLLILHAEDAYGGCSFKLREA